jgi:NAD+ kinase
MLDSAAVSEHYEPAQPVVSPRQTAWRLGVVVHPSRNIDTPLNALREWTGDHGVDLVQVPVPEVQREVAEPGHASDCDLIVSIGGDGTMLAAIRVAAGANRPVLGVACGSLGVLTTVEGDSVARALRRFDQDDWTPQRLPALELATEHGERLNAFNDVTIVRSGEGQVRVDARIDGVLFSRIAGDGCIVSTPIGTSGYALAAGGPLLGPGAEGFLFTPLPTHGGSCPPVVIAVDSVLELDATAGHGGARLELDGQVAGAQLGSMTVTLRPEVATLVSFDDQLPLFTCLRRRRILIDSPRILAEDSRG